MVPLHSSERCITQTCADSWNFASNHIRRLKLSVVKKGKRFPYSLLSVVDGADPRVQAVIPQVT